MKVIKSHAPTKVKALFTPFELTLFVESERDEDLLNNILCLVPEHWADTREFVQIIRDVLDKA